MKSDRPSLFLYFTACVLVVFFKILRCDTYILYTKSIIIPILFIFYFIANNYRINKIKAMIFLFCFIGDIFNLLHFEISPLGALLSFLIVNLLLLKLSYDNFRDLEFDKTDGFPFLISFLFITAISISVFSLQFEHLVFDLSLYIFYGIVLSLLTLVSIANYIKKPNFAFLNMATMCLCFMISDIFFMINKFYLSLYAFSFLQVLVQAVSYLFMTLYFVENDKYFLKNK